MAETAWGSLEVPRVSDRLSPPSVGAKVTHLQLEEEQGEEQGVPLKEEEGRRKEEEGRRELLFLLSEKEEEGA